MIHVESNADIAKKQAEAGAAADAQAEAKAKAVETRLENLVWTEFDAARRAKEPIQNQMLDLLRARRSQYTGAQLALIEAEGGGSQVFIPLTQEKITAAVSWLCDLFLSERPFACEPTPIPDVPPEVAAAIEQEMQFRLQQMQIVAESPEDLRNMIEAEKERVLYEARQFAQKRAAKNTDRVDDEFVEGDFYKSLMNAIDDACGLKAGFIKGPVVRNKRVLTWGPNGKTAVAEVKPKRYYTSPSPLDIYPAPGLLDLNSGHLSERMRLTPQEVSELKGVPGFRDDVIDQCILEFGTQGTQNWWWEDAERADLEQRSADTLITQRGLYDVIEHRTHATGKMLREFGMPPEEVPNEAEVYSVVCWMIGRDRLIGARLNDDPLGKRPYAKFGFRGARGSFWYDSVGEIMAPMQAMANAAGRSLANNMAMAAGFITEIQVDRIPDGEPIKVPGAYSVMQTIAPTNGTAGPAVYFHQPVIHAQVYIAVHGWASQVADAILGLPSFLSGASTGGGAGDTSSGLAQLRDMATRTFKRTVMDVDNAVADIADRTHTDIVLTEGQNDPDLVGDVTVKAVGSKAFQDRAQQQVRLNELVMQTNNPTDLQLMGPEGRAELLRAALKSFDAIDIDRTIPNREQVIMKAKTAAAAAVGMDINGNPLPGAPQGGPPRGRATLPDGSVAGGADQGAMQ